MSHSATLEKPQAAPAGAKQSPDSLINGDLASTVNSESSSTINSNSAGTQQQRKEMSGGTQLALAEPPKVQGDQGIEAAVAPTIPTFNLTVDALPHDFGGWTLEHNWDNQHPDTCRLRSVKAKINDGYESTWLWAEILPDEINIYTGSNIDLDYEGAGLQFGNQPVEAFTGFLTETAATMAGDFSKVLADAGTVTVYLGFWPTWPKTEVQQVTLSGQALAKALAAFDACQTW